MKKSPSKGLRPLATPAGNGSGNRVHRYAPSKRLILLAMKLTYKRMSLTDIADYLDVSRKTAFRYIRALEDMELPVKAIKDYSSDGESEQFAGALRSYYSIDAHWIKKLI